MHKRIFWRSLRLLLVVALCLGALATAGAVGRNEVPVRPEAMPVADVPSEETSPAPTQEEIRAAEEEAKAASARQRRASGLLARRGGLTGQQREVLCTRMGADEVLLQRLERGELTRTELTWLGRRSPRSGCRNPDPCPNSPGEQ